MHISAQGIVSRKKKEPAADLPVQSKQETSTANGHVPGIKRGADPVPEAPTRVGSGEGNNRSKVLPPHKFCREMASNPGPGDSAS
jgi:hypothetical protein